MFQSPIEVDCVPKNDHINNESECSELVFLTLAIALPKLSSLSMESHSGNSVAPFLLQMERELIAERTRAGLEAARKLGRTGGRPRSVTDGKLRSAKKLLRTGMLPRDVADDLGISLATLYRWIPEAATLSQ
jgi:hypothetical protein